MRRYSRRSVGNIFFNKSKRALSKTTTKDGEDKKVEKKDGNPHQSKFGKKNRTRTHNAPLKKNNLKQTNIQIKKLKTLLTLKEDKKGMKQDQSFHLIGEEDKYKCIEKNLQNKLLKMSILMLTDLSFHTVFDEELNIKPKSNHNSNSKLEIQPHVIGIIDKSKTPKGKNLNLYRKSFFQVRQSLFLANSPRPQTKGKSTSRTNLSNKGNTVIKEMIYEKFRRINRTKQLYDSQGEDESDKDLEKSDYGLNPRTIFIDTFDMILLICTGFFLFYIPYRLARTKMVINNDEHLILFLIHFAEFIFILDLIFGFFRWYYNKEYKLVSNGYMIIKHYLSGNFGFDLIMAFPFYTLLKYSEEKKVNYETLFNEKHFFLKIIICFKAFKIFKLKNSKNNRIVYFLSGKFTKNYYLERLYQISNFILIMLSVFNLFICFHIYMAEQSYPNWIVANDLQDKSFIEIYLASLYFIIATITSVGYGDITCVSFEETCFQIILLSIGLVAYSWIISTVGDYVKNLSRATLNYNRDMTKLEEIRVQYPNMPYKLYNKIQQHIQRILKQSKKYEYNILVNSLPYYLQNSLLFQIHKNEIDRFTFFKDCDNSDFILKVLTHFIPIFSKKNIVLVGEGEFFENIFYIKNGRLAMEAIIDLDQIEMSIEKYLKYRFEEIEELEDFYDDEDEDNDVSKEKAKLTNDTFDPRKMKLKKKTPSKTRNNFMEIINKQFENIEDTTELCQSDIEQEIGKCDFHEENRDLYKGNIQYIHILDLLKNEYFGDLLMFLNIPNPLSLRVKSKRVELYVLRKKDAFNIKRDYQNIWQRINKKSIHNIKSLKSLTLGVINRYCGMNGILLEGNEIIRKKTRSFGDLSRTSAFMNKNKTYSKKVTTKSRFSQSRKSITSIQKSNFKANTVETKPKHIRFKETRKESSPEINIKIISNGDNEESDIKNEKYRSSGTSRKLKETIIDTLESLSSLNITLSGKNKNRKFKTNIKKSNNDSRKLSIQNTILKNKNNYSSKASKKLKTLQPFSSKSTKNNKKQSISNKKQSFKITGISSIKEFNTSRFHYNELTTEKTISFKLSCNYKNIDDIANGQYIGDNKFQETVKKFVSYYIKAEENVKNYLNQLNYFKYFENVFKKNKYNSDIQECNIRNTIVENPSFSSDKNGKIISNNIGIGYSNSNIKNDASFGDIKNKYNFENQKETFSPKFKDKILLEQTENKSINSKNKLNSIIVNKKAEIFSDNNNNDISKEQLNNGDNNYKPVQTFQEMKNKEENNNKIIKQEDKPPDTNNVYTNNILNNKNGNNIHEVNLNYVNNFCLIY